jgi:hypothetical protein
VERISQQDGAGVHSFSDSPQSGRAMIHGVHARHDGEQDLRGAHVAGRLVPPDVLLARLQSHPQGRAAISVL